MNSEDIEEKMNEWEETARRKLKNGKTRRDRSKPEKDERKYKNKNKEM